VRALASLLAKPPCSSIICYLHLASQLISLATVSINHSYNYCSYFLRLEVRQLLDIWLSSTRVEFLILVILSFWFNTDDLISPRPTCQLSIPCVVIAEHYPPAARVYFSSEELSQPSVRLRIESFVRSNCFDTFLSLLHISLSCRFHPAPRYDGGRTFLRPIGKNGKHLPSNLRSIHTLVFFWWYAQGKGMNILGSRSTHCVRARKVSPGKVGPCLRCTYDTRGEISGWTNRKEL
jgi:hypothetical protein